MNGEPMTTTLYNCNDEPIKGQAFTIRLPGLTSQADTDIFRTNPTLAAGDVKIYGDGTLLGNSTNVPTVDDVAGTGVSLVLTATETNYNQIRTVWQDAAGSEWQSFGIWIFTKVAVTVSDFDDTVDTVSLADGGITAAKIADNAIDAGAIAVDAITAAKIATGAIDADALAADAVIEIQSGLSTLTAAQVWSYATRTLSSLGTLVADIWAYTTRTLTQTATGAGDTASTGAITRRRGDTWTLSITGLGALTDYISLDFILKLTKDDADTASKIWVRKNASSLNDGLLYINGSISGVTASDGSIAVDNLALGNITVTVKAAATAQLKPDGYYYEIQKIGTTGNAAFVNTPEVGTFSVTADVVRAVS